MKLGILGTGMIVKDVLTMYHELGVEKTYLFSTKKSKSQALELIEKYHLDKVYTDYDELLQSDVDTIYCSLPNHLHYEFSKKALENDKNVIIEKPITANSKELEDLIETNFKNIISDTTTDKRNQIWTNFVRKYNTQGSSYITAMNESAKNIFNK